MSLSDVFSPKAVLAAFVLSTAAMALPAAAQTPPTTPPAQPGQPGGNGGRGGNGRQNFQDRMKEQLGLSDDEWKAVQPKIDKVNQLRRDAAGGGFGGRGRGGPGGRGGNGAPGGAAGGADAQPAPDPASVQAKSKELRDTLDNKSASADEIKTKLAALRDAKAKAKADLAKAEDDLRGVLTARQEAVMVTYGMLE